MIFTYPQPEGRRRHGPSGYTKYERYRPWLRDEFSFRCVYCLQRENWTLVVHEFEIDHLQPQSRCREKATSYENLVYACSRCNSIKSDQSVCDPFFVLVNGQIKVLESGEVKGISRDAKRLILQLDLYSDIMVQWRKDMLERERSIRNSNPGTWQRIVGFPDRLPNLRTLRPPVNSRLEGLDESWFSKRVRDELPDEY